MSGPRPAIFNVGGRLIRLIASSSVASPFSSDSRPTKSAYCPGAVRRPGSGSRKFGFTSIFSVGHPPSTNFCLANSEMAI